MSAMSQKSLYIKTYGCQMNVYDSDKMADVLRPLGYVQADAPDNADMVILNTCHIREKAAEKLYSELGRLRKEKERQKAQGKHMVLAVAGCVGQAEGEEVFARAPHVDLVVGPQSYHRLPDMLARLGAEEKADVLDVDFTPEDKFDRLPEEATSQGASAFLTIQEGCDKFCTFCVVPYTRGAEFSRPVPEVYREALRLVAGGAKEITLLGQNVNAYHGEGLDGDVWDLARLIAHLAKITGLERIRYTTSHPRDMHIALIEAHGTVEKLMPFLHLPVQAGSDRILAAMNRKHTADHYRRIVDALKQARPDIALSSDFIVGFPGETDEDFEETLRLVRDVEFAQAYSFKYSPRPGTRAATEEDQVPEAVKDARLQALQALLNQQKSAFNAQALDMVMPVLLDREGRFDGQLVGKTPYMQSVHISAPAHYKGQIVDIKITKTHENSLSGAVVEVPTLTQPKVAA